MTNHCLAGMAQIPAHLQNYLLKGETTMKKILAIAITLVMVFAVAASAFALFGFQANATPILVDGIEVDVQLYDLGPTGAGNSLLLGNYPVHAPTSGVRAGETYAFAVSVLIPDADGMTAAGRALIDAASTDNGLTINTSNLTGFAVITGAPVDVPATASVTGRAFTNYGAPFAIAGGECFIDNTDLETIATLPAASDAIGAQEYIFVAECDIATLADATVSAVYGAPNPDVTAAPATCTIGNWGVSFAASAYTMAEYNSLGALSGNQVVFAVGGADNAGNQPILSTYVVGTGAYAGPYVVSQNPTTGEIQFHDDVTSTPLDRVTDPDTYAVLNGILTRAMAAMGFTWTPGGVLYDEGFEALASRGLQFSDSATFYAYTAALTVPGTATVPDTGDNTVVGIVMMAVAVLATAAIVINKVRA